LNRPKGYIAASFSSQIVRTISRKTPMRVSIQTSSSVVIS
jgi:hypothetical protein